MYASSSSSSALTSRPASQYLPEVGVSRHPIRFMSVDLPEPEGPMMATYSPRRISTVTPRRAWTSSEPIWYVFQRSSVLMANPWSMRSWRNESGETASTGMNQLLELSGAELLILAGQALLPVRLCVSEAALDRQECLSYQTHLYVSAND